MTEARRKVQRVGTFVSSAYRTASVLGVLAVAAWGLAGPAIASEAVDKAAASKLIEERYGVKVLRIREAEDDGKRVFILTVMNPGGTSNDAFQVNTLALDPATGKLISQYRHTPTGHRHSGAERRSPVLDGSGPVIRQRSTRGIPGR